MAGIMTMYEVNGRLPEQYHPPYPSASSPTERPIAPSSVTHFLNDLLYGQHVGLLQEFLRALDKAGYRIPPQYLPNLLDKGAKAAKLRPFIYPILGNEGQWLADHNPIWHYASSDIFTWDGVLRYWHNNDNLRRTTLLTQIRQQNPQLAKQLIDNFWRSTPDTARHQLLQTLETKISMADEPLLETALDDRQHLVRKKAVDLLGYLPDSRFAKRMTHYVPHFLQWNAGKIIVQFPQELSPQMLRDGIEQNNPRINLVGLRTRQLTHLIASVPLNYWTTEWGVPIATILKAITKTRWTRTMLSGLTTAARKQSDQLWIEHLLIEKKFSTMVSPLIKFVDTTTLQTFVLENKSLFFAKADLIDRDHPMRTVLYNFPHQWDEPVNRFWIEQFADYIKQSKSRPTIDPQLKLMLSRLLNNTPLPLFDFAKQTLAEAAQINEKWKTAVHPMFNTMKFRQAMLEAIATDSSTKAGNGKLSQK
jgi:hypothetical protein